MAATQEHTTEGEAPPPSVLATPSSSSAKPGAKLKTKDKEGEDDDAPKEERTVKPERIQPESLREMRRGENQELADYLGALKGQAAIQIAVHRLKPAMFAGKAIKGHIETIEETITEDEMRDRWGGGQYQLKIKRRNDQGSWVFLTSTVVDISGDPRTDNLPGAIQNGAGGPSFAAIQADADSRVVTQALNMFERQTSEMRELLKKDTGFDPKMIEAFMKPMEMQMKAMLDESKRKDAQLDAVLAKPVDPFQQKMLESLIDGDSARLTSLRAQHESELRMLKENHLADLKRLEDRMERDRSDQKRDYERQLDNMKNSYERELTATKALHAQVDIAATSSNTIIKTSLERDIARVERELDVLRAENKALREKKDQSLLEKAKEIDAVKELLGVGDGEEKEKSGFERIVDTALQSEQLMNFAGRWLGPNQQPAQGQAKPAQSQAVQRVPPKYVRDKRTGEIGEWDAKLQNYVVIPKRRGGNAGGGGIPELQIPPEQLQMAITILERAYANHTKPANLAATISTALPPEIYQAIRDHGVDGFVNKVAKLGASSPLRRQDGINWLREVGKHLLGDDAPSNDDDQIDDIDDDALNDAPE